MTDAEKRAHDLAIAVTMYCTQPEMLRGIANANGDNEVHVDFYQAYKGAYDMLLPAFMRDFPE